MDTQEILNHIIAATGLLAEQAPANIPLIARQGSDSRGRMRVVIPEATDENGLPRAVVVRALSPRLRSDASVAAHRYVSNRLGPPPPNPHQRESYLLMYHDAVAERQIVEEAALMLFEPPDMSASEVENWNDNAVQRIHLAGTLAGKLPTGLINAELTRLHGAPPPAHPDATAVGGVADARPLDADPRRTDATPDSGSGSTDDGGVVPADRAVAVPDRVG